ncbi:amidohydrolase family protein [Sporichthya sp.]|uniref:amidohydrolase family protein n=1 Tax=Sporichthya sp. TaxID=65475 RepID=UPI0017EDDF56|nr:amidohydrolase family protein [Sporichthya sp.]MBA3741463.1 amidohydrolase family protein [Sporichthya sp.]
MTVRVGQTDRPLFLRQLSTDEYLPQPYSDVDKLVVAKTVDRIETASAERRRDVSDLADGRAGTAAGLRELNAEWGETYYDVPEDAVRDDDAASDVFDGPEFVIDVQTHFMAPHGVRSFPTQMLIDLYRATMPTWWTQLDDIVAMDLACYIRNVFLECETGVAVLTSGPGVDDWRNLFNDEMHATRMLIDGLAGTGRLLNHAVVHPKIDHELEGMEAFRDEFQPAGWKVYTLGVLTEQGPQEGWALTDDEGMRFLEKARALDVRLVCAHKGISWLANNGSPADIGPAAKAFPDLDFLIYHSGYEMESYGAPPEGPFTEETADDGINRLIKSVRDAEIDRTNGNVYAELGTTWFSVIRRPEEAAHVMGKLLLHFGADNIVWGTDSIFYGSAQPLIDAFRTFQIPDRLCEQFGYPKLTAEAKDKILSRNAARLYKVDVPTMQERVKNDDLSWARDLLREVEKHGFAGLR